MFAARQQHIENVILPALKSGARMWCPTAYRCRFCLPGRRARRAVCRHRNAGKLGAGQPAPRFNLALDVPLEVSMSRIAQAREKDRFEQEEAAFFTRVRDAYLSRAAAAQALCTHRQQPRFGLGAPIGGRSVSRHFQKPA